MCRRPAVWSDVTQHNGEAPWWQRGVIYQVYPRSFQDGNGDGIGDLPGITRRLGHLRWLGVDAVWLSPIFASPMEDGGYDVTDYTAVDPMFGTLDDAEGLIGEAHRLGLRVVLDFVPNHTSHQHPWFLESRHARDSARRGWYIWRDPAPGGGPPNNWRSVSDDRPGSAWILDEPTGQYFLATFSAVQPDLNWANAEVRGAMHDVLRFWLDRGVDGFRIDMVGFLAKDPEFRDEASAAPGAPFDYVREARRHFNRHETIEHLREMRQVVDAYPGTVLIGEMIYEAPVDLLVTYARDAGIDVPTNFKLITLPLDPELIAAHVDEYDRATAEAGVWPNYCVSNHDMPRPTRFGPQRARLALLMLLTLRGTPFVYYGDEIGMPNVVVPADRRDDRWVVSLEGVSRDSVRTPMQWDATANAGFCPAGVTPWLPVSDDYELVNVEAQRDVSGSMLSFVRHLLATRRDIPALTVGGYRPLPDVPPGCMGFLREHDEQRVLTLLNFSDDDRSYRLPNVHGLRVLASTGDTSAVKGDPDGGRASASEPAGGDPDVVVALGPQSAVVAAIG